jgi:hypothetical protein
MLFVLECSSVKGFKTPIGGDQGSTEVDGS